MLNKDGQRMLAYIVTIEELRPIPNYDRVEHARTGGWWIVVRKGDFNVGDKALYLEVDSKVPSNDDRFAFLEAKHYKVKTQKMCKVYSQGLLMPLVDFPELHDKDVNDDATELLKITYSVEEDNKRKAKSDPNAKYNRMAARHPKLAKKKWFRWLMKRTWGKKLLFALFGKKKDKPKDFPEWIKKTDEERVENMKWILENKDPWIKTEKLDGTSTTFALDLTAKKPDFIVCSRNVRQIDMNQTNYHTQVGIDNVYWEMAFKYNVEEALKKIADKYHGKRIILQGETYGEALQGNVYKLNERRFAAFNLIFDGERLDSIMAREILAEYNIPFVPIIDINYILPDDFEDFKLSADGTSTIANVKREGFVYRSLDGKHSFKNVSREYLLKHS